MESASALAPAGCAGQVTGFRAADFYAQGDSLLAGLAEPAGSGRRRRGRERRRDGSGLTKPAGEAGRALSWDSGQCASPGSRKPGMAGRGADPALRTQPRFPSRSGVGGPGAGPGPEPSLAFLHAGTSAGLGLDQRGGPQRGANRGRWARPSAQRTGKLRQGHGQIWELPGGTGLGACVLTCPSWHIPRKRQESRQGNNNSSKMPWASERGLGGKEDKRVGRCISSIPALNRAVLPSGQHPPRARPGREPLAAEDTQ